MDERRLVELCEKITVGHVGPMRHEYQEMGIPFLRSQNIQPFRLDLSSIKYISKKFHTKLKKSALFPGDVVVVRTGYPGVACVIPDSLSESNCADLVIIRTQKDLDPYYLCSIFNSQYGQQLVSGRLVGVAQQHFNITEAKNMIIHTPPIETQKKISAVLSSFDDLIEVNLRQIRVLEELALALYDEWFVRIRFPRHDNTEITQTEHGPTPKGWKYKPIGEVIETLGGGTPSTKNNAFWDNGDIEWYTPSDLTSNNAMFITESSRKITKRGLQKSSAKLFPAYSVMMTSRATLGVVSINTKEACTNQGFITCVPNEKLSKYYLYFWIIQNVDRIINLASGATFKEINKTTFRKIPVLIPDSETMKIFVEKMKPIGALIENLLKKNKILKIYRDLLLPKLISGEIDISDIDIAE